MRKEAKKQSKFKHYILTPIRILKGVAGCTGGFAGCGAGVGAGSAVQISHNPETKSIDLKLSRENNDDRQSELLRTVPIIRSNAGNETRAVMHGERMVTVRNNEGNETRVVMHRRQRKPNAGYKYNRTKMSYYSEVRKMVRIDEDKPCSFEEDQNDSKAQLLHLFPRSRTNYVVNMRNVNYQ